MALLSKNILVRSNSSVSEQGVLSFAESWLSGFDRSEPDNQFFAFIIDRKHNKSIIYFSPNARAVYSISSSDNPIDLVDIPSIVEQIDTSGGGLSEQEVQGMITDALDGFSGGITELRVNELIQESLPQVMTEQRVVEIIGENEIGQDTLTREEVQAMIDAAIQDKTSTEDVANMIKASEESDLTQDQIDSILDNLELSEEDIQRIAEQVQDGIKNDIAPDPQEIINDVALLVANGIDPDEVKDIVVAMKNAQITISATDVVTEVKRTVTEDVVGELDITQAQNDVVKGAIEFLTSGDKLDEIVNSAYIGSFRSVLTNLAQQNADLAQRLADDDRITINIT